ncbi:MAG: arabinogalactan endo,4-beta-galactosidase [Flaviaesturariibacter sp.]|nr:arabinogalactan endo,4-beta-galactosidase [Flaviaesturariibacter sp.]
MKQFPVLLLTILLSLGCEKGGSADTPPAAPPVTLPTTPVFAKGADVGWSTEMEAANKKFYTAAGVETEGMTLLKSLGMNAIRLRVWVNPAGGWNGSPDVVAKAVRAKALGLRVMIDFHYSDTWADPGHQSKPAAWTGNLAALKSALATHTTDVLNALKTAGVTPEWVQVGNETNDGMLWPDGKASTNMSAFAQLVTAGYDAVKAVVPTAKVIVHVSNGWDNSLFRWLFDGLQANGAKWDVIGLSLYPTTSNWATINQQAFTNMNDMVSRFGKEVMVVEVGMPWDRPTESGAFLADIIAKTKAINGNKGLGVFYWEPLAYGGWQGYTLGAFDNAGKPTSALNAFQ